MCHSGHQASSGDRCSTGGSWLACFLLSLVACGGSASSPREGPPAAAAPAEAPASGVSSPPAAELPPLIPSPLADALTPLLVDALAQPEEARPYLRYILATRGLPAPESDQEEAALVRLVNSTSLAPQLAAPVPLAVLGAYRLDLRDYRWERPIAVAGSTFPDAWEAIVDHSGLALPALAGERLAALTGTRTAVLPARAFMTAASSGALYYALTDVPQIEIQLQERLAARFPDPETEDVYNAGLGQDARHRYQGARRLLLPDGSAYWQGLPDTPRGNSLFADPLDFNSWETDVIYPLPNGMPGFFLDTPYSQPIPGPTTQLVNHRADAPDQVVADCLACHSSGPLPMQDALGPYLRDSLAAYDDATMDLIRNRWPTQQEFDAIVAADRASYERVLERAGLSADSAGALQAITRRYAGELELTDMAAALHASEAQVRAVLPAGTPTLGAESFLVQFRGLLCQIHPDANAGDYCP